MPAQSYTNEKSLANATATATATSDRILDEGRLITDDGISISTYFVNLESAPEFHWPYELPLLVRGSSNRNAITNGATVHLSKPEKFRKQGETLISDPNEGITNREVVQVDGVCDLNRAAEVDDEMRRGASMLQVEQQRETSRIRTSAKTTQTYGKNCWIWCTAIASETDAVGNSWMQSLGDDYDCVNIIRHPRKFARALAAAVAEQLGARGSPIECKHPYGSATTEHHSQYVFHGPVAYVDDPHDYVAQGANDFQRTLRAAFFKHSDYASQREYRFVVWADTEPDELVVDLVATPDILAEVEPDSGDGYSEQNIAREEVQSDTHSARSASAAPNILIGIDQAKRPSIPVDFAEDTSPTSMPMRAVSTETETMNTSRDVQLVHHDIVPAGKIVQVSSKVHTVTVQTSRYPLKGNHSFRTELSIVPSARNARAHALHYLFHNLANENDFSKALTAALFHAERVASRLLLVFVDPIDRIRWSESEVILDIKTPADNNNTTVSIAIGPQGSAQYKITSGQEYEHVMCVDVVVASEVFVEDLQELGLYTCEAAVKAGHIPMLPPITIPSDERPDAQNKNTAQIHRRTVRDGSDVDEAGIDAANAKMEPRPDDARITKLVIDGGPGAIGKWYGIREGLSGNLRTRVRRDRLSIHVETMNPDATVEIDPPDSAPNQDGHVVAVPDGEDTVITITATSPDGTAQSKIEWTAERSGESEQETA